MAERTDGRTTKAKPARKTSPVQMVVALVVCCGALFWAYRKASEGMRPINRWASQLRSGDVEERQTAARQLGGSAPEDLDVAIPALIAAMGDQESPVRAEVASDLGIAGPTAMNAGKKAEAKEAAKVLLRSFADAQPEVRMAAVNALGEFLAQSGDQDSPVDKAEAVPALAGLLADASDMVRSSAGLVLARIAGKAPIGPPSALVEGLGTWPSKESRAEAALALGAFKAEAGPTVAALTRALVDKEADVRSAAADALRRFGPDAAPAVPSLVKTLADPFAPPPPPENGVVLAPMMGAGGGSDAATLPPTDPAVQAARALGQILKAQAEKGVKPPDDAIEALTRAKQSDRQDLKDAADDALRVLSGSPRRGLGRPPRGGPAGSRR